MSVLVYLEHAGGVVDEPSLQAAALARSLADASGTTVAAILASDAASQGVEDAPADEIQRAYRTLARTYHPDVNRDPAAEDRFKEISEAPLGSHHQGGFMSQQIWEMQALNLWTD